MFIQNDINAEREAVLTGRIINHGFTYSDAPSQADGANNYDAEGYHLDNGTNVLGDYSGSVTPKGAEWVPTVATSATFDVDGIQVNDNLLVHNTPVLQVALSDLFPFLRWNQLPLFMMDEQVSIELVFAAKGDDVAATKRVALGVNASTTEASPDITQGSVQMVADYIF